MDRDTTPRRRPRSDKAASEPRKPGRPSRIADASGSLPTRAMILHRASELAKAEPVAELSIARLAREFGVTSALIHYYVGSLDDVVSGVINRYFKAWVERAPAPEGDWRTDLENLARLTYAVMVEYGGVPRYILLHNQFRLFQNVAEGETDYGVEFFDRFGKVLKCAKLTPTRAALAYHLIAQFVLSCAHAVVSRQLPGQHEKYVYEKLKATSKESYGGAHFLAKPFSKLDADTTFEAGLQMLLDGIGAWAPQK